MSKERKLDQFISLIVLILFAAVIALKWVMIYQSVAPEVIRALDIVTAIIKCLMVCVVLYNALGWTENWLFKIIFIIIALFLVVTIVVCQVPSIQESFQNWNIPIDFI